MKHAISIGLLIVAATGCKRAEASTETFVVLDAEANVARNTRSLHMHVRSERDGQTLLDQTVDARWPFRIALAPQHGDASRQFRVLAEAIASDGRTLGRVQVVSGFVANQLRYVHLLFEDGCQSLVDKCVLNDLTCRAGSCAPATAQLLVTPPMHATADGAANAAPMDGGVDPRPPAAAQSGSTASVPAFAGTPGPAGRAPTAGMPQLMAAGSGAGVGAVGASAGKAGVAAMGGAAAEDPAVACGEPRVTFRRNAPIVWLVIDGSSSMQELTPQQISRWQALRQSVLNRSPTGIFAQVQYGTQLGLEIYDGPSPGGDAGVDSATCLRRTRVMPAPGNLEAIATAFPMNPPGGTSPTHRALEDILQTVPSPRVASDPERYVLLITDGGANDFCVNVGTDPDIQTRVLTAIQALTQRGVTTYVVSLAPSSDPANSQLSALASAGSSKGLLSAAARNWGLDFLWIEALAGVGCSPQMNVRIQSGLECNGSVTMDLAPLPCSEVDGFSLKDESTITLHGKSCQQWRSSPLVMLQAQWPCSAYLGPAKN